MCDIRLLEIGIHSARVQSVHLDPPGTEPSWSSNTRCMNYDGMTATDGVVNDSGGDFVALARPPCCLLQSATSGLPHPGTETEEGKSKKNTPSFPEGAIRFPVNPLESGEKEKGAGRYKFMPGKKAYGYF